MAAAAIDLCPSSMEERKEDRQHLIDSGQEENGKMEEDEEELAAEEAKRSIDKTISHNDIDFSESPTPTPPGSNDIEDSETVKLLDDHISSLDKLSLSEKKKEARLSSLLKQVEEDYPELKVHQSVVAEISEAETTPDMSSSRARTTTTTTFTSQTSHIVLIDEQPRPSGLEAAAMDKEVESRIESLGGFTSSSIHQYKVGGSNSEVDRSEAATTDSLETDTCDLYQTVGSQTPNSQSNVELYKSLAATIASSQATFISADDVLGSIEGGPTMPHLASTKDLEDSTRYASSSQFEEKDEQGEMEEEEEEVGSSKKENHLDADQASEADGNICITQLADESTDATVLAPVCLYPAQVHQYCPPGLEGLLDCGQLVIHKENLRHNRVFNTNALRKMEVIDISRKVLFYVEEEAPPLTDNSFLFKVYNKDKQEVMQIYNPQSNTCFGCGASWHCLRKCHFQALIFAPLGQVAGFVKRSHTYFVQEFLVMNSQEDVLLIMRGGPDDLEIYTPDLNDELGRLSVHHWHGIMHEVRRSHSDYGITFPIDLDVRVKAVLLGAVFSLDWMYSTRGGRLR